MLKNKYDIAGKTSTILSLIFIRIKIAAVIIIIKQNDVSINKISILSPINSPNPPSNCREPTNFL